jgi:hypothetical protein
MVYRVANGKKIQCCKKCGSENDTIGKLCSKCFGKMLERWCNRK